MISAIILSLLAGLGGGMVTLWVLLYNSVFDSWAPFAVAVTVFCINFYKVMSKG